MTDGLLIKIILQELPHIGVHCSNSKCNQLDFLPFICSYCKQTFCQEHYKPTNGEDGHECSQRPLDTRATTCPLCHQVIPVHRGQTPDRYVEMHIQRGCPPESASTSSAAYPNACSFAGCKKREAVPIVCGKCLLQFCIRHRLEMDHACVPKQQVSSGFDAFFSKLKPSKRDNSKQKPNECIIS